MKRYFWIAGLGIFILLLFAGFYYFTYVHQSDKLPVLGNPGHVVGDFSFTDQTGQPFTQQDMNGKVSVVEFFYTTCPDLCPRMNANLQKVYEKFKHTPGFEILSHTVNPAHDTPPVLAKYAEQYDADPRVWKFLTGPAQKIYSMAENDYLIGSVDSAHVSGLFVHSQWWALVDKHRRIRGFYDGTNPQDISKLEHDIPILLKEK
ncbi:SCO family protein [Thermoflavifilum thermophilum]|uniref:Protein SCO1/2 n=1 Tax=Thermoflavifilum thermophilum TaxID=1393122 RepID=A0A1I7NCD2_9BACT|nr:SCO family protein [Thermoflavifilum thermophilum]SFV32345.1 protein SCO1/2 [Thermoflavifilum thermophilum]